VVRRLYFINRGKKREFLSPATSLPVGIDEQQVQPPLGDTFFVRPKEFYRY